MSNVILFEAGNVPAHIAARFSGASNTDLSNGVGGGGFPVISYKGKVWHVVKGDDRHLIANEDGDPRSSIEVVILKANPNISKIFYQGGYEEGSSAKPTCYSNDGQAPARDAQEPQATKCAICPHNAWGSRVTDNGAKGKACSDSRRLAVAPVGDLENPMLLRIPAGSLKDLTGYAEMLNKRNTPYVAVITKIGFDHTVAHQKLTFKPVRFLSDVEADVVTEVLERDVIRNITGQDYDISATAEDVIEGTPPAKLMKQVEPEPKPAAKKTTQRSVASEDEVESALATPAAAEEAPEPAPAKKASKVDAILAEADKTLDDILGELDD